MSAKIRNYRKIPHFAFGMNMSFKTGFLPPTPIFAPAFSVYLYTIQKQNGFCHSKVYQKRFQRNPQIDSGNY